MWGAPSGGSVAPACRAASGACPSTRSRTPEHRLDVDDRRPIQRLEVVHADPRALNRDDLHLVEADRVRAVGGASAEHAGQRVPAVVARMDTEYVSTGAVEPREHDDLVAGANVAQPIHHPFVEDQPRGRRSLAALLGRAARVGEGDCTTPMGASAMGDGSIARWK